MPKATKRERQRQNKEARRAAMQEAEKRHRRNRSIRLGGIVLVIVVGLAVLFSALNSNDDSKSKSSAATCSTKVPPKPTTTTLSAAPTLTIDPAKQYTAVMKTSCGDITIALDASTAPQTVNSFVTLAKSGFYDGTFFHRIITDFVDQGGDPTGTGTGGPGYQLPDEPPADGYQAGSVAMANSGSGTTGSQFFLVVSASGAQQLGTSAPYKYSALGTMDSASLKIAKKINTFGNSTTGKPSQKVYVLSVAINESAATTTTTAAATTTTAAP